MLPDLAIAVFLAVCLTIFACVNLCNLKRFSASKKRDRYRAEVRQLSGSIFILAALGTLIFFLESVLYIVLVFTGFYEIAGGFFFQLRFPFSSLVQFVGIFATVFGYALFLCSVLARGRYAVSWEMPENQKLVTWGPYRYVRHPSYLAYFILFAGLFFIFLNLIAVIPFIAIPSYVRITIAEEELLTKRFGETYLGYQRATGKFFPRRKQQG